MTDFVLALVVWRISHLLVHEPAPFELAARFRHAIGVRYDARSAAVGSNEVAKLFTCVWCLSVWVGWLVALAHYRSWDFIVYGLAYSTLCCLLEAWVK